MPKYEKPSSMSEETWQIINEVVTNDTGETAQNFIKSFESEEQLQTHLKQIKKEAGMADPIIKAGIETAYTAGLYSFPNPTVRKLMKRRNSTAKIGGTTVAGHLTEALRRYNLRPFIRGCEDSLTNNYSKLPKKSQPLGIKEAVKAMTPTAGNAGIVNQSPPAIGIPQ